MVPSYDTFTADTPWPDWVTVAFQALVICWLPAHVQVTRHELIVVDPLFFTVTLETNPLPQSVCTA